MRVGFCAILILLVLAACSIRQQRELPTLVPWPADLTSTAQVAALNEVTEPTSAELEAVIAPATFAATSVAQLIDPVTFAATAEVTIAPTLTPSLSATATPIPPTNTATPIPPSATPFLTATPFPEHEEAAYSRITYEEARALLLETPFMLVPEEHIRQIYARGRERGLNPDFLLSVGDCNSESRWYLQSLLDDSPPQGEAADMSFYQDAAVQSTIDYYRIAFAFKGQSVNSGLNAMSVMDPFWANTNLCSAGVSPLECDFQQTQPFAALIMFGANDILVLNTASYEMALRDIIEFTLEHDIIPILSTFTVRPLDNRTFTQGVRFNGVVVHLAQEYNIPLVNFWLAARAVDNYGILADNAHLTVDGFNVRNHLTLDLLTVLRRDVLALEDGT